ncbi:anti-phage deoxyguanosine triphosphatase [Psychrobacter sp. FBL11]|uniref:Deoxyguanosinetriphosphate triphosphohydrolase-like protein n=1 Tax=Psychrobacter saeujeotis TaxID=3143436 RepID=A0ABU9XAR0_9GAMM|nr:anti-phage deoxyguanosine triphosphatase [uncultured Psychrobacter sp.]
MIDDIFKGKMEARRKYQPYRSGDVRSQFDRDEARLIHSAAFRRLQSKTQVLGLGESDFYRTRLTHSMEVAQIGRGIVQYLEKSDNFSMYQEYLPDMALISAICLAHDIGHPPFGHGGEVALNYCMRNDGGFEGNGQTLRILGKLDKYTEQHGLNPTRRMLLGVLKYPASYSSLINDNFYEDENNPDVPYWLFKADAQKPPKCYYDIDKDIVEFIFEGFDEKDVKKFTAFESKKDKHQGTRFKSLDCTIMNLADNISYSLHDLEDALSLGMISREQWREHFKDNASLFDIVENLDSERVEEESNFNCLTRKLFDDESYERKDAIGRLVNLMITNVEIVENGSDCENPLLGLEVKLEKEVEALRENIFKLVCEVVIKDENVQQLEFKGQKLVIELFQVLAKDPKRFLPKSTKAIWINSTKNVPVENHESVQARVICDFIAGMTDDYATKFYEKFFTPNKGSIFDRL